MLFKKNYTSFKFSKQIGHVGKLNIWAEALATVASLDMSDTAVGWFS